MPLKCLLISDDSGIPFYSREFDFEGIDAALLSGLLSAVGTIGKTLFRQDIATITFGENVQPKNTSKIIVISKEFFSIKKQIFFVFFYHGEQKMKQLRQLATTIFMEAKQSFKDRAPETQQLGKMIDRIIELKFNDLKGW
ncbi:hypothetical protein DSAG12_02376 [Promethearchaeum syntrophicum]|uniref:Roadblock/LAMTOR2 domain-containing protein n=1 Tax=Promethearchaeum syntrophicum TaxID=2594042 RepID=A0A5B9DCV7_9ARCH|nr:hypothetical protein [Candidatus Prometheoarchaeum syntrophicum]QEE16546.1 hypothetical protein DSAG12_02376 [Candidatus Prometheoarchaeum syntrophicum]